MIGDPYVVHGRLCCAALPRPGFGRIVFRSGGTPYSGVFHPEGDPSDGFFHGASHCIAPVIWGLRPVVTPSPYRAPSVKWRPASAKMRAPLFFINYPIPVRSSGFASRKTPFAATKNLSPLPALVAEGELKLVVGALRVRSRGMRPPRDFLGTLFSLGRFFPLLLTHCTGIG